MTNLTTEAEHGHGHGHGTGVPWLDILVAFSAIFISVVSLVVSIEHGKTMEKMVQQNEKMVAASTVPFLTFGGSQLDPGTNKPLVRLILKNGGVGPAVINWFELRYKGTAYSKYEPLLRACCQSALKGPGTGTSVIYSNVSHTILPARESVEVLKIRPEPDDQLLRAFDSARSRDEVTARACYCSVLGECWLTDFGPQSPQPVKACKPPAGSVLW